MSMNRFTWAWPGSAASQARRNSSSVSGPSLVNVSTPPGRRTRRHSRKTASGSLHHCSIRLENNHVRAAGGKRQRGRIGRDAAEATQQRLPPARLAQHAGREVQRRSRGFSDSAVSARSRRGRCPPRDRPRPGDPCGPRRAARATRCGPLPGSPPPRRNAARPDRTRPLHAAVSSVSAAASGTGPRRRTDGRTRFRRAGKIAFEKRNDLCQHGPALRQERRMPGRGIWTNRAIGSAAASSRPAAAGVRRSCSPADHQGRQGQAWQDAAQVRVAQHREPRLERGAIGFAMQRYAGTQRAQAPALRARRPRSAAPGNCRSCAGSRCPARSRSPPARPGPCHAASRSAVTNEGVVAISTSAAMSADRCRANSSATMPPSDQPSTAAPGGTLAETARASAPRSPGVATAALRPWPGRSTTCRRACLRAGRARDPTCRRARPSRAAGRGRGRSRAIRRAVPARRRRHDVRSIQQAAALRAAECVEQPCNVGTRVRRRERETQSRGPGRHGRRPDRRHPDAPVPAAPLLSAIACRFGPDEQGLDRRSRGHQAQPERCSARRETPRHGARTRARRPGSSRMTRNAARVAAATAGGNAVV